MLGKVRLWYQARRFTVRLAALAAVLVAALVAALLIFGTAAASKWAPVLAACVAVLSLVVTAAAAVANWLRQKREAAIKAWIEWSDSRLESRRTVQRFLGENAMTREQAEALINRRALKGNDGVEVDADKRAELGNAVVHVLNGLERLAAGANLNVYDAKTVRALGGTIIVATYTKLERYIQARRTAEDEDARQRNAFVELEWLVHGIRRGDLLNRKRELDSARIRHLAETRK